MGSYGEGCLYVYGQVPNVLASEGEHKKPLGLLQPLYVSICKWEHMSMGFGDSFPCSLKGNDIIKVIIGRLTKFVHLVPISVER